MFQGDRTYDSFLVYNCKPLVSADKETVFIHTGGIDHCLRQGIALKEAGKLVGHDLHHALARGAEPEIAGIIGHDIHDRIIHRNVYQLRKFSILDDADSVSAADPDSAVDVLKVLDLVEGRDIDRPHLLQGGLTAAAVVDMRISFRHVEAAGSGRVGKDGVDVAVFALFKAEIAVRPAMVQSKDRARIIHAVEEAVTSRTELMDELFLQSGIVRLPDHHIRTDGRDSVGRGDIDHAVRVLGYRSHGRGAQAVLFVPVPELPFFHDKNTAVIGADPQAVLPVDIEASDAGDPGGGVHPHKGIAVVADQSAVAADPDEAISGLGDDVGL